MIMIIYFVEINLAKIIKYYSIMLTVDQSNHTIYVTEQ